MPAKKRKEQPEIKVSLASFNKDERMALKEEWDKREPEFDHQFKRADVPQGELSRLDMEVVKDGDDVVTNRTSILIRTPKAKWLAQKQVEAQVSVSRTESIRNEDGSSVVDDDSVKWAKPKKPKRVA